MEEYEFWEQALKNPAAIGKDIKTDENSPQSGFYRTKQGIPVAIWRDTDGFLVVLRGDDIVPERDYGDVWLRCLNRPVTENQYNAKRDTGLWHDEVEAVSETLGGNIKDSEDPATIKQMIDGLTAEADKYDSVRSDEDAAQAQSIRARLNELSGKADKLHTVEKAPHLEAGRKVDKKWNPMIKEADAAAQKLRSAIARWEDVKREAERKRLADIAEAARLAEEAGRPAPAPSEPEVEQPRARVSGAYGRAASVRTRNVVVAITDGVAVFKRYRNNPDVVALLIRLAQRDIDSNISVEGVEVEEKADVR